MTTTRNLILAAAALLTLGTTALSSTEASAYGFHYRWHYHSYRHFSHWGYRYHWNYHRFAWPSHYRYSYRYHWPIRHYYWRTSWRGPAALGSVGGPSYSYAPQAPAQIAAPTPSRPPCLAKRYTPEGAVMFIDRCTQESAVAPPPGADAAPPAEGQKPPQ